MLKSPHADETLVLWAQYQLKSEYSQVKSAGKTSSYLLH